MQFRCEALTTSTCEKTWTALHKAAVIPVPFFFVFHMVMHSVSKSPKKSLLKTSEASYVCLSQDVK